jgi:ribonuclease HI
MNNATKLAVMFTASKKRKLGDDVTKYYAVRAGKTPGVYMTWKECQDQTTGFKGASYKSFTSKRDADDFVAGKEVASSAGAGKGTEDRFYGIAVGHNPGVYQTWTAAQEQIRDVKGPKYKKFASREEAEEFVRSGGKASKKTDASKAAKKEDKSNGTVVEGPSTKKAKTSSSNGKTVKVWTDGSSRGNGRVGAIAGVGVYFGEDDPRQVSI